MSVLPESIDPDDLKRLIEKLSSDPQDFEGLEFIRQHMRYIYKEEHSADYQNYLQNLGLHKPSESE